MFDDSVFGERAEYYLSRDYDMPTHENIGIEKWRTFVQRELTRAPAFDHHNSHQSLIAALKKECSYYLQKNEFHNVSEIAQLLVLMTPVRASNQPLPQDVGENTTHELTFQQVCVYGYFCAICILLIICCTLYHRRVIKLLNTTSG